MKKTILHIIDNLGRGGAETMLVTVIKQLEEYDHIIVTLTPENEFGNELPSCKYFCLDMHSPLKAPLAALKLRKMIAQHNVELVHSHLFWSTVVARLGVAGSIPLVSTIHTFPSSSIEYGAWKMRMIEKITFNIRKSTIITVAKGALEDYMDHIKVKPANANYLYTFAGDAAFNTVSNKKKSGSFRLVTVGNLKPLKNQQFLLEAFKQLKNENVTLDIYGKGPLEEQFQQLIKSHDLKITLKGQVTNIQDHIGAYDLFVMPSSYEGFSLAVLEAMAMGLPLLLTDIPSFKEQCDDTAVYYKLNDTNDFIGQLQSLNNNRQQLEFLGNSCRRRAVENFTLQKHLQGLRSIYHDALAIQQPITALSFAK